MRKRFLAALLCLCMVVTLLPTVAQAAGVNAIQLGTGGISDPVEKTSDRGKYYTPSSYIYYGQDGTDPVKWRVLDADKNNNNTDGMFLLSEHVFGTDVYFDNTRQPANSVWAGSDAQAWCKDFAGESGTSVVDTFRTDELAAIQSISKTDYKIDKLYDSRITWGDSTLDSDKVFFLSVAELAAYVGDYSTAPGLQAFRKDNISNTSWWLRSPYRLYDNCVGIVEFDGTVLCSDVDYAYNLSARPAFNLDLSSVLFSSAAEGGKTSGAVGAAALQGVSTTTTNGWKLTLKSSERSEFQAVTTEIGSNALAITYFNAKTGANEYISAIVKDSNGNVTHYGRLKNTTEAADASGTVTVTLPTNMAGNALYIFNEQYNGDKMTDYASDLVPVSLTDASDVAAPILTDVAVSRTGDTSATVTFTSNEAGQYYYEAVASGSPAPTVTAEGTGTDYSAGEQTITLTLAKGTKDVYIVVKDAAGNKSAPLKITIPAYVPETVYCPAIQLDLTDNHVLFISAAVGGKSSGATGTYALKAVPNDTAVTEWKQTLKDSSRSEFTVSLNNPVEPVNPNHVAVKAGDSFSINYSGAKPAAMNIFPPY